MNRAKAEAKMAGGNAIKIIDHIPPGASTYHRITAKILRSNRFAVPSGYDIYECLSRNDGNTDYRKLTLIKIITHG